MHYISLPCTSLTLFVSFLNKVKDLVFGMFGYMFNIGQMFHLFMTVKSVIFLHSIVFFKYSQIITVRKQFFFASHH